MEAWEDSKASLGGIWTSQFCALHSYQGEDGSKKPQADGRDHEATAHLNVSFTTENEKSSIIKKEDERIFLPKQTETDKNSPSRASIEGKSLQLDTPVESVTHVFHKLDQKVAVVMTVPSTEDTFQ